MSQQQNKAFRSQTARDRFLRHLLRVVERIEEDADWAACQTWSGPIGAWGGP